MKKLNVRQVLAAFALILFAASISSCNRGYGCPQNFSIDQDAVTTVKNAISTVIKK
jgi:predicted small secreted protein